MYISIGIDYFTGLKLRQFQRLAKCYKVKNEYRIIGLMSGTSLDGVDLAFCSFQSDNASFKIMNSSTYSYDIEWKNRLKNADRLDGAEIALLNADISKLFALYINQFINKYKLENIDAISSHGHTIFHQPEKGYTLQIGNGAYLSAITGYSIISDFRSADIALGGQGAPLVPIGDRNLFANYTNRINLGGFANISYEIEGTTYAFDICPLNMALNEISNKLNLEYDDGGSIARSGKICGSLLKDLNAVEFYHLKGPKSLGKEWYRENFQVLLTNSECSIEDKLRTLTEHMAIQIDRSMIKGNALLSGGGTYNLFLIDRIKEISENEIIIPETDIIDFKEAMVFAYLGYLRILKNINVLASVTGAKKDHIAGTIHLV